jgi:S-formylglutathione hydrolase FrmB
LSIRTFRRRAATLAFAAALSVVIPLRAAVGAAAEIIVTYDNALAGIFEGRVYLLVTQGQRDPRFGPQWFGTEPFLAADARHWTSEIPLRLLTTQMLAYPSGAGDFAPGTYRAQAVLRLGRESARLGTGAGNAYSAPVEFTIGADGVVPLVRLHVDQLVAEAPLEETDRIKLVETPSAILSAFHRRPVMHRAAVRLPVGYDASGERRYPALYYVGGFGADHRMVRMGERMWRGLAGEDAIVRVVLDPSCYGGHHAFADSDNNGPCGRALVDELIPHLESTFRLVGGPGARFLGGHSSGGWASLWLQVAYPDTFGGTWSTAPDPVDFTRFQTIDVYANGANAYVDATGAPVPVAQRNGAPFAMMRDFVAMETVYGEGGQIRSFEWVFSPRGADGLPMPLFDRATGAIDPAVAASWRRYDIRAILERRWAELAPKLAGKLHVFVGDQDTFYLHLAVERLKESLSRLGSDAVVEIQPGHDHGSLLSRELLERIDREMLESFAKAVSGAGG